MSGTYESQCNQILNLLASAHCLRGQVKTGQRRSGQNRPTEVAWD